MTRMSRMILVLLPATLAAACAFPGDDERLARARYDAAAGPFLAEAEASGVAGDAPAPLGPFRDSLGLPGPER